MPPLHIGYAFASKAQASRSLAGHFAQGNLRMVTEDSPRHSVEGIKARSARNVTCFHEFLRGNPEEAANAK